MNEVTAVFFEECREALDLLESGLLTLHGGADRESINTIFRAAHSIKGGAAMFGFQPIGDFTHGVETLLDEMRQGKRVVSDSTVQVLLQACDCLREMVTAARNGQPLDGTRARDLDAQLTSLLIAPDAPSAPRPRRGWRIRFSPVPDLLKVRNEPTRMFAELAKLGALSVQVDRSCLPPLETLDPETCYLAWELEVLGDVARSAIDDVFDWVDPACGLEISELTAVVAPVSAVQPAPVSRTPTSQAAVNAAALRQPAAAVHKPADSGSLRVATDKIDQLINLVGELVITQSMLGEFTDEHTPSGMRQGLAQLARNTRELQDSVMRIRMLPIGAALFSRFPRVVHDLAAKLGKKVDLQLIGEGTELDKTVLEKITDPFVHLIRNALDHGLETPEHRRRAGKDETGSLQLAAFHEGGNVIIEVRDDGAGLNTQKILGRARAQNLVSADQELSNDEIHNLIFLPGFSTADQVSDVSGRGVGMDVVRRNINDLGGHVHISGSHGHGSVIRIRLPLTLAILDGQLVRVGSDTYVISLLSIVETIQIPRRRLKTVGGSAEVFRLRDEFLPVLKLCELFGGTCNSQRTEDGLLVVVESESERVGLLVDDLLAQQQVVIKSLEKNFRPVDGVMGATILGDGQVALIIDVPGLISLAAQRARSPGAGQAA